MITKTQAFLVFGNPEPKGSLTAYKRGARIVMTEDNKDGPRWRKHVGDSAHKHTTEHAAPRQPLILDAIFTLARPRAHYGTGRNANRVREAAPTYPSLFGTGDLDKLVRNVMDALADEGVRVFDNDAQVVKFGQIEKRYAVWPGYTDTSGGAQFPMVGARAVWGELETPGAWIRVRPLPGATY